MASMSRRVIFAKKKPSKSPFRRGDEKPAGADEPMVEVSAEERAARYAELAMRAGNTPRRPISRQPAFSTKRMVVYGAVTLTVLLGFWWAFVAFDVARYLQTPSYASAPRQPSLDGLSSPRSRGGASPGVGAGAPGYGTGPGMGADGRPLPTDDSFRATFNVHRKQGEAGVSNAMPNAVPQDAPRIEVVGECAVTTNSASGQLQGLDTCFKGGRK